MTNKELKMKKRMRFRKEVKENFVKGLGAVIFILAIVCFIQYGQARFEKINHGEMTLVNQSEMYR